ncbi:hypothetical protein C8R46DRAFT_1197581 [Mycena filopes]|nr:hypothetical protein C8R46DRAFT_1197581 [Mycena filopes]
MATASTSRASMSSAPNAGANRFSSMISRWAPPHQLTLDEQDAIRKEGLRYLAIVHRLEKVQRETHPEPLSPQLQTSLTLARQTYMFINFRLFKINKLPTEIICDIIRLAVWDSMRRPVDARLRITWTCRLWRQIALADSTLWNAIWFRGTRISRAWAWFERAGQSPLDVRIDGPKDEDEELAVLGLSEPLTAAAICMRETITRLFTKLSHLRMLIVVVDDWQSALLVLELLASHAPSGVPQLQRFELHRGGLNNEDRQTLSWPAVVPQPFLGGAVAPALEYLSLNGVPIDWSRCILENLTTFDIRRLPSTHSPDAARFREILTNCPRLQKLSMGRRRFTAPNVNDLTLMNLCGASYVPLFVQITASFPKVRLLSAYSLQFEATPHGWTAMTRWLDSMPLLAYLRVANVAKEFFRLFLTPPGADPNRKTLVAPSLATLDIQAIEPVVLVQWAKDRHAAGVPLSRIYISEELGERLKGDQIAALTSICILAKLPRGATTPEEEALSAFPFSQGNLVAYDASSTNNHSSGTAVSRFGLLQATKMIGGVTVNRYGMLPTNSDRIQSSSVHGQLLSTSTST